VKVRITQLDGKLPNIALMRLSAWHKARGDEVHFYRGAQGLSRNLGEPEYDRVYASAIFTMSRPLISRFSAQFPSAIVGGTGTQSAAKIEDLIGDFSGLDYEAAPAGFAASIGFTQRGCRLKCKFCVVPAKEGKPYVVGSVYDIWRGPPWPKHLHLLDNDFFGQPEADWRRRLEEIRIGGFKVCFNQGFNVRLITQEGANELATVQYRDDSFTRRRLYTAWDNLKDEAIFFRGVDRLAAAGIPEKHLMVYMLIGFDPSETWERIHYRFKRMVDRGMWPYPMVYDPERRDLKRFQRWVVTGLYRTMPFEHYSTSRVQHRRQYEESFL